MRPFTRLGPRSGRRAGGASIHGAGPAAPPSRALAAAFLAVLAAGAPAAAALAAAPPASVSTPPSAPSPAPGSSSTAASAALPAPPAGGAPAGGAWSGDNAASAGAAVGSGSTIDLFYGAPLGAQAWLGRDQQALSAALGAGTASLTDLYNQWLAIADLRAAVYEAEGQLEPDGVIVYPPGPSAVAHALDLAQWARENAILAELGVQSAQPYPAASDLGYRDAGDYIDPALVPTTITPAQVASILDSLDLPAALFAGDRIMLMPYDMPQEYGLTDVIGPEIRIWIGADASIDLPHVLEHELGHAIHFRFGGYDSIYTSAGGTRPLSAFWENYLAMRGLQWHDPALYPWAQQTPECFAEDVASLFDGPDDILGYQAACDPPTAQQASALLALLRGLGFSSGASSPFQQSGWIQWSLPWPNAVMGDFEALFFTSAPQVAVSVSLDANAVGGPYTVDVPGAAAPLATLEPGAGWSGTVDVPAGGSAEIEADSPTYYLSGPLRFYRNAAFVPVPRISGVFPDTLDSWARADVAAAVRAGIAGGFPDGTFAPDAPVTRAQFARILASALPSLLYRTAPGSALPPDVPATSWEAPFVAAVVGALPGYAAGQAFLPDQAVTREEAAAWTVRAFGWAALPPPSAEALLETYPDGLAAAGADAPWFATALNMGLIVGDAGTGLLRPDAPLDRAEAAVLVLRAMQEAPAAGGNAAGAGSTPNGAPAPATGGA